MPHDLGLPAHEIHHIRHWSENMSLVACDKQIASGTCGVWIPSGQSHNLARIRECQICSAHRTSFYLWLRHNSDLAHAGHNAVAFKKTALIRARACRILRYESTAWRENSSGKISVGRRIDHVESMSQHSDSSQTVVESRRVGGGVYAVGKSAHDNCRRQISREIRDKRTAESGSIGCATPGTDKTEHRICIEIRAAENIKHYRSIRNLSQKKRIIVIKNKKWPDWMSVDKIEFATGFEQSFVTLWIYGDRWQTEPWERLTCIRHKKIGRTDSALRHDPDNSGVDTRHHR